MGVYGMLLPNEVYQFELTATVISTPLSLNLFKKRLVPVSLSEFHTKE